MKITLKATRIYGHEHICVRTCRSGRNNPGSNLGHVKRFLFILFIALIYVDVITNCPGLYQGIPCEIRMEGHHSVITLGMTDQRVNLAFIEYKTSEIYMKIIFTPTETST